MLVKLIVIACILAIGAADSEVFLKASNKFAARLLKKTIEEKGGNIIVSPLSIQKSLTMSMFGAAGVTEAEMKHGLNYDDISNEEVLKIYGQITKDFKNLATLKSANKFFVMKNISLKPSYKDIAVKTFDSDVENVDFEDRDKSAEIINQWVESKTEHKIKDIVKPETLESTTRLVIVNAIHFKDQWQFKFDPANTYKSKFVLEDKTEVETDFMSLKTKFNTAYMSDSNFHVVEIPYKDADTSMFIFFPSYTLPELEEKIEEIDWKNIQSKMHSLEMILQIPKFKFEFEIELNKVLTDMGMKRMFTDSAEFPNLIDSRAELHISKVIHKAFIAVDEEGTEAAAATVQNMKFRTGPRVMKINRPFLFVIKSKSHVLFMGRYVKPAQ